MRTLLAMTTLTLILGCSQEKLVPKFENEADEISFGLKSLANFSSLAHQSIQQLGDEAIEHNDLAKKNKIKELTEDFQKFVGKKITWNVTCSVSENGVYIMPNMFDKNGEVFPGSLFRETKELAVRLVDKEFESDRSNPEDWWLIVEIPKEISAADAAKLPENIKLSATIERIEIGSLNLGIPEQYHVHELSDLYAVHVFVKGVSLAAR